VEECVKQKKTVLHLWKKYDTVVLLKNGTKVAKLAKYFAIPTKMLTTVLKNEDKIISHFFLSEYT